ncbi:hypothetical protein ABIE60_000375 [Marinobacterium sp. MBR-109]|jgi:hypothetical protein
MILTQANSDRLGGNADRLVSDTDKLEQDREQPIALLPKSLIAVLPSPVRFHKQQAYCTSEKGQALLNEVRP